MKRSHNLFSLVCLLLLSILVTFAGGSSVAHADSKYVVTQGNTLWGIAQTHHTSVTALMKRNALHSTLLQIHQSLWIPSSSKKPLKSQSKQHQITYHTVRPGDTLWNLAVTNHTSVNTLMKMNHLSSTVIHPGQRLKVFESGQKSVVYDLKRKSVHRIDHSITHKGIPVRLIPVYQAAAKRYGISWTILAAIHKKETNFSTNPVVSYEGAEGPMQFMPSTFETYGVTAPECHGQPNINNVYDAIYTAAHMLALDGCAKNPTAAIYQYNHSMAYVESIEALARTYAA